MFIKKIITAIVSVRLSGCGGESLDQYAPTNLNFIKKYLSFNLHDTRNIQYEKSTVSIILSCYRAYGTFKRGFSRKLPIFDKFTVQRNVKVFLQV